VQQQRRFYKRSEKLFYMRGGQDPANPMEKGRTSAQYTGSCLGSKTDLGKRYVAQRGLAPKIRDTSRRWKRTLVAASPQGKPQGNPAHPVTGNSSGAFKASQ